MENAVPDLIEGGIYVFIGSISETLRRANLYILRTENVITSIYYAFNRLSITVKE